MSTQGFDFSPTPFVWRSRFVPMREQLQQEIRVEWAKQLDSFRARMRVLDQADLRRTTGVVSMPPSTTPPGVASGVSVPEETRGLLTRFRGA